MEVYKKLEAFNIGVLKIKNIKMNQKVRARIAIL